MADKSISELLSSVESLSTDDLLLVSQVFYDKYLTKRIKYGDFLSLLLKDVYSNGLIPLSTRLSNDYYTKLSTYSKPAIDNMLSALSTDITDNLSVQLSSLNDWYYTKPELSSSSELDIKFLAMEKVDKELSAAIDNIISETQISVEHTLLSNGIGSIKTVPATNLVYFNCAALSTEIGKITGYERKNFYVWASSKNDGSNPTWTKAVLLTPKQEAKLLLPVATSAPAPRRSRKRNGK